MNSLLGDDMALLNTLMIYFIIFQPDPNASYALTMGQLMHMPYSSDINFSNYEINIGVDIGAGYASSIIMGGAPGITYRQRVGEYITGFSAFAFGDAAAFSMQLNSNFPLMKRKVFWRSDISYLQFHDLSDKYSMYAGNAAMIIPFKWGNYVSPFIGTGIRIVYSDFPENISSDHINADMHFVYGMTINISIVYFNISAEVSNAVLGWGANTGVNW